MLFGRRIGGDNKAPSGERLIPALLAEVLVDALLADPASSAFGKQVSAR